jgi:hypothetical protein
LKNKHEKRYFLKLKKEKIGTFNIDAMNVLNMGKPILGWYHWEPLQGLVKEPKVAKSFFLGPFL